MPTPAQQLAARKLYGGEGTIPAYLDQEVLTWSPEKITLKTYDLFIVSCKQNNAPRMNRVLVELMGALNFDYPEPANRLYELYDYCQRCIAQKKNNEALNIIQELRDTWAKAFNLE
ncbi:MAG: flagellar export chaperone FliS [Candidatus Kapaibacterium sp.]